MGRQPHRLAGPARRGRRQPGHSRLRRPARVADLAGLPPAYIEVGQLDIFRDEVAIAAITAAELLVGVELATAARHQAREAFVGDVLATIPIEEYDLEVARAHARLLADVRRTGRPRGAHDLIVAATAAATGRTVVTSHGSGFDRLPDVAVLAPTR